MRVLAGDNIVVLMQSVDSELRSNELDEIFQSDKPAKTRSDVTLSTPAEEKFQSAFISYYRAAILLSGMDADPDAADKIFPFQPVGDESLNQNVITRMAKTDSRSFSATLFMDGVDGSLKGAIATAFFLSSEETNNSTVMMLAFLCSMCQADGEAPDIAKGIELFSALTADSDTGEREYSDDRYLFKFAKMDSTWIVTVLPVNNAEF